MAKNKKNVPAAAPVDAKAQKKADKESKKLAKDKKSTKKVKPLAVKRSRAKETISELKKVNWPSFGTVCKHTGMVLAVVLIFGVVLLGVNSLLGWLIKLIMGIGA